MAKLRYCAVFRHRNSHEYAHDNVACIIAKGQIKDVDKLRSRILTAWDELDQRVIDTAVRQSPTDLRAC